ncbi:MAG: zinc ribbon domain-containing protein, partial [Candidatus Thorarchaeota archaeon]
RSKYISSFVYSILAVILLVVGIVALALSLVFPPYVLIFNAIILPISIVLLVIGFILLISAAVMEMRAWENLKEFFQQNKELVPDALRHEVIDGCDNLRTGALLYALGFLGITIIIGFIFKIVGYFKLGKLNTLLYQPESKKEISQYQVQYQPQQTQYPQPTSPSKEQIVEKPVESVNFCPNCGTKLSRGGRFCPLCGSEVN